MREGREERPGEREREGRGGEGRGGEGRGGDWKGGQQLHVVKWEVGLYNKAVSMVTLQPVVCTVTALYSGRDTVVVILVNSHSLDELAL